MPLRDAAPITFRALGVCDAVDGSNAPEGAMLSLKNLIPNPKMARTFVPRPAAVQFTNFAGFTAPTKINAMLTIGTKVYGMVASGRFAGKDEPFCYDLTAGVFVAITGPTAANCPASPPATGDWRPPTMAQVGKRILITHPGYPGGATKFGWIDTRGFTSTAVTGDTHTNTLIDNLTQNPINSGWAIGDRVTGAGVAANTFITAMTATTITLSQATTATAAGVALVVTSGTTAAPIYGAGDTNTTNLVGTPVAVAQFNGRAWFAVNNSVAYTDALKPWLITAATQALTLGDDLAVTALGGLPLSTQVSGGVVQSLVAFKADAPYWQITGDAATTTLRVDQVAGSVGTLSPLSVTPTPLGLAYVAPDGLRIIDPISGRADEVIGANGTGVTAAFIYAIAPSRTCAAFARNILRISGQNGSIDSQPTQEWWYHFSLGIWSGPHDFAPSLIQACYSGETDFVLAATGVNAKLFEGTVSPSAASTYTENGAAMSWMWQTSMFPENNTGNANHMVESSMGYALPANQSLTIQALDEAGNSLDNIGINGDDTGDAVWGSFTWGVGVWGGAVTPFQQWTMPWAKTLNFKQASMLVYGQSVSGFVIGNLLAKVQATGFQGGH